MTAMPLPPVVIGVDIGTTSTKVVAFDSTGAASGSASAGYPLHHLRPGHAEQHPDETLAAVRGTIAAVTGRPRGAGAAPPDRDAGPPDVFADQADLVPLAPGRGSDGESLGGNQGVRPAPAVRAMDHSVASGTRLLELRRLSWDGEAHRRSTWRPIWSPSPNGCARYAQLAPVFTGLYESLLPIFTAPHDLVPVLPLRDDEPDAP